MRSIGHASKKPKEPAEISNPAATESNSNGSGGSEACVQPAALVIRSIGVDIAHPHPSAGDRDKIKAKSLENRAEGTSETAHASSGSRFDAPLERKNLTRTFLRCWLHSAELAKAIIFRTVRPHRYESFPGCNLASTAAWNTDSGRRSNKKRYRVSLTFERGAFSEPDSFSG